jgi:4-alpha-glucanotransferase
LITPAVDRLRDELGLPGMVVLHWAFGGSPTNPHALSNHRPNQIVYTSTHDTDTSVGWFEAMNEAERSGTGLDPAEPHWGLIRLAMQSPANVAIVPAQDVLGLGSQARMNHPGEVEGNWSWQLAPGQLTAADAERLRAETESASRLPK